MELRVAPLAEGEWSAARQLFHRAFLDEPWTAVLYGESRLHRWGRSWDLYSPLRSEDYSIALGARVAEVVVGALIGSTPERCHLCQVVAREPQPEDQQLAIDWEFHQNIARVHVPLGPHAWVAKVGVEPALHGLGIGPRLLEAAAATLRGQGPTTELVLECAPNRVGFYLALGFEQTATFPDPAGPDCSLMSIQVRPDSA